jgi:hypothetical protein
MSDTETTSRGSEIVISDALLQTGALTDEQARVVAEHQAKTGLTFDEAALALALATEELSLIHI